MRSRADQNDFYNESEYDEEESAAEWGRRAGGTVSGAREYASLETENVDGCARDDERDPSQKSLDNEACKLDRKKRKAEHESYGVKEC